ncbi:hypothetical protein GCM10023080_079000 [Streptomyces pseudoechinosporeus]
MLSSYCCVIYKTDNYELQFLDPVLAARRGLIAVVQDVHGRFTSEGGFVPLVNEASDGADTIEWAAQLPGSSGAVGMWGISYLGNVQWQWVRCVGMITLRCHGLWLFSLGMRARRQTLVKSRWPGSWLVRLPRAS